MPPARGGAATRGADQQRRGECATGSHVRYVQTGGFAGLKLVAELDTSTLDAGQAAELEDLIDAALNAPPAGRGNPLLRDDQQYEITIVREGRTTVLRSSEAAISRPVAALVERVRTRARPAR